MKLVETVGINSPQNWGFCYLTPTLDSLKSPPHCDAKKSIIVLLRVHISVIRSKTLFGYLDRIAKRTYHFILLSIWLRVLIYKVDLYRTIVLIIYSLVKSSTKNTYLFKRHLGPKLTQKGSILILYGPKCKYCAEIVHISSKHIYVVLYTCNNKPMIIFWCFIALS